MTEEWRLISGYEPYKASSLGRILGMSGRILTPVTTQYGYHQVSIVHGGRKLTRFVHRLVATAFLGPQPTPEHDVLHYDGSRTNNAVANLRWGTPVENNLDQERHGRRIKGDTHPRAKTNAEEVREIRRKFAAGMTVTEISRIHTSLTRRSLYTVAHGETWKHVA